MDPLTHALSGALLARATARATPDALPLRRQVAAGFAAALFPDADLVLRLAGTIHYLNWHQGPTHSLLLWPLWGLLLAQLFARLDRGRRWQAYYPVACLGIAIHIAGDLLTAYGTMLFAPLSSARFALPLAFVIDPRLTAIIGLGLLGARVAPHGRAVAGAALVLLAAYLGFLHLQREQALAIGEAYRAALPGGGAAQLSALPQPLAANWLVVVRAADGYHIARVRLRGALPASVAALLPGRLRALDAAFRPPDAAQWRWLAQFGEEPGDAALAREAWRQPAFAPFRRFAALPLLDRVERGAGSECAWFMDLRFVLPALPPSFRFAACREAPDGAWRMVRARGAFWID